MDNVEAPDGPHDAVGEAGQQDRWRTVLAGLVVLLVVAAAVAAIYRDREPFFAALQQIGGTPLALAFIFGCFGVALSFPIWRAILHGLDADLPIGHASRVFFVSQLGKYLPGAVWPIVIQMEAARAKGVSRRNVLLGNLITLIVSCSVGLVLAALMLPAHRPEALRQYWWVMLALPLLLGLLHPRALPTLVDKMSLLLRRPALGDSVPGTSIAMAAGWSVLAWTAFGAHLTVLCGALGASGIGVFLLCTGGMGLAVSAGVLFIPAPAGGGVREVVLLLVLMAVLTRGEALAVVVTSRALLLASDLILAALAWVARRRLLSA